MGTVENEEFVLQTRQRGPTNTIHKHITLQEHSHGKFIKAAASLNLHRYCMSV